MGFSTPKPPFNLAQFLSEKGTPRSSRKPQWQRRSPTSATEAEVTVDDETAADLSESPAEGSVRPE
jgi:hypothetical protein